MNQLEFILFTILLVAVFLTMILFVLFGQVTVRKLRKNPETKNDLGIEFVSGWNIINVAKALAIPQKLKDSPLSALYTNVELLHKHTNAFDRTLAILFYWVLIFSGFSGTLLVLLNAVGAFD